MLAFSIVPCSDEIGAELNAEVHYVTQSHQSGEDHTDTCTPFCICSCCAGFSMTYLVAPCIESNPGNNINHSSFYKAITQSVSLPVWQPPQLS